MEMRAQEPTDEQLVRQALTDTDAFGMLVERYERPLSSYAARLVGRQEADCLLYTSPSPRDGLLYRMPSSA